MKILTTILTCILMSGCLILWDDECDRVDPDYSHTEYDCYYVSSPVDVCDRYQCWTEYRDVQVCDEYHVCYERRRR
jgi:hypothetical protein